MHELAGITCIIISSSVVIIINRGECRIADNEVLQAEFEFKEEEKG